MDLNFKSFGSGEPLIILHGLFGTLDNWQTLARRFAEHYTVYIVDQRNHGRSPHLDSMDYPTLAEDLRTFMESQWIYHAHIIGHSMGGKTAMQFSVEHPDRVNKLIVVDIAPKAYPGLHEQIFDALLSLDLLAIQSRQEAEAWLEPRIEDSSVRQFLMKNLTRGKEGTFEWKMNLPVIYKYYGHILAPISVREAFEAPTLFIRGQRSRYILDEDWTMIQDYFPNASLFTIPGAGHWVHAEAPDQFFETSMRFLST
jgi:pimeloyl-ACP methyl ester carboxylesterase